MTDGARFLAAEIKKRYGAVRRARGCYLYTEKGVRLTDMYLDNGRALLGWDAGKARTVFKNTFERGITGCYDSGMMQRLDTAAKRFLPACYTVLRWWNSTSAAAAGYTGEPWRPWSDISGTVTETATGYPHIELCPGDARTELPDIITFVPPFPWTDAPCVYAFKNADSTAIPPSDTIPAPLAAGITRALYDLKQAYGVRSEEKFAAFDAVFAPCFTRRGCWLFPVLPEETYRDFVLRCLDAGMVLSPDFSVPSVVPYGANGGDVKRMRHLLPPGEK